ncbi:osmosensor SHO1 KNAG_0C03390 [Huiozyma naganishii CBS 8797]|uniref:High osmolarity signaling protein SHO1 n=1 Tax=Huiozyma naganishii (strain ATCC MYA-139 / BCRC 22969 / CBS 8797 / KCTC 17520 / NBRC 10181 / NCYC 3082 / Yp74L-3) TaxID=1071383 RepID=J7S5Z4_HUIN7|nr:hypothetical protein KNAG_0C03390 [Kazachstania naganishii CBS 8797]CCK69446.1 hypothetical protein KNAG_0C03390 [Kazachstania naganishii CBS 8797]
MDFTRPLQKQRRTFTQRHRFEVKNLLGDPFAISTTSIALISWIITIGGSIAVASDNEPFPRFTWWGIGFEFFLICLISVFYCYNVVDYYRIFLCGSLSVAFVYTTNSATNLVYSDGSRKAAASAGVVLLSIVNFIWLFYFGGDNASPFNRWIDSFSLHGIRPSPYEHSTLRARRRSSKPLASTPRPVTRYTTETNQDQQPFHDGSYQGNNYMSSTALSGFENTEPQFNPGTQYDTINTHHMPQVDEATGARARGTYLTNENTDTTMSGTLGLYSELGDEENFMYTAKALYSYDADSNDQYEVSFEQGEILKVSDIEGRWWKARRANGETGIIPSNYVELIES